MNKSSTAEKKLIELKSPWYECPKEGCKFKMFSPMVIHVIEHVKKCKFFSVVERKNAIYELYTLPLTAVMHDKGIQTPKFLSIKKKDMRGAQKVQIKASKIYHEPTPQSEGMNTLKKDIRFIFVNKHVHVRDGNSCSCSWGSEEMIEALLSLFESYIESRKPTDSIFESNDTSEEKAGYVVGYHNALKDYRTSLIEGIDL